MSFTISRRVSSWVPVSVSAVCIVALCLGSALPRNEGGGSSSGDPTPEQNAAKMIKEGRDTFRFATFGDEQFWGQTLHLNQTVAGSANGGIGPGLSPKQALALGLKVDIAMLPLSVQQALSAGQLNLDDPKITIDLLALKSVIGVTGFVTKQGLLESIGIQCAICHSTVDDSFAPGIGKRLDGWANRDLDVGSIIAFAPDLSVLANLLGTSQNGVRQVLHSWGPGKFDAELVLDGKAFAPGGASAATLIPPAFGLVGVNLHTWTGWGSVTHWNGFVATIEMHGKGTFFDPRLDDAAVFPIAAQAGFGHIHNDPDLVTPKLAALHFYQLAIPAPKALEGGFDPAAALRGKKLFDGVAKCSSCHVEPLYSEPGWNMHTPAEVGIDSFQADRSPDKRYRTTPLKGLWTHQKGGFYHDGRFATLIDVVNHYDAFLQLNLASGDKSDLVQFLLSI